MTDPELWNLAVAVVSDEFARLSPSRRAHVTEAAAGITSCKAALHAVTSSVASDDICAACGGGCCRTGKYHFTAVDLLVYLVDGKELFTPRFGQKACPYLGVQGCLMEPAYRPFTCITFNCDLVERLLAPEDKERLVRLERELRRCYGAVEETAGVRLMGGLLMNAERDFVPGRSPLFREN